MENRSRYCAELHALITWLRDNKVQDGDILDCMMYITEVGVRAQEAGRGVAPAWDYDLLTEHMEPEEFQALTKWIQAHPAYGLDAQACIQYIKQQTKE